jgi:hypothetical protein
VADDQRQPPDVETILEALAAAGLRPGPNFFDGSPDDVLPVTGDPWPFLEIHLSTRVAAPAFVAGPAEAEEWPRAETDCACRAGGDECPCEADGPDGLCACCRDEEREDAHRGVCAAPGRPQ